MARKRPDQTASSLLKGRQRIKDILLKAGKERRVVDASELFPDCGADRDNDILRTEVPPKIPCCIGVNGPPYKRLFPKPSC
ncbi:MAG: hypothetical protein PHC97_01400 [Patescibacteria group bacterium]|nr:hypothetical protein [Patescibacteria group bacterium]